MAAISDEQLAKFDNDIAAALIEASEYHIEQTTKEPIRRKVCIQRNGKPLFSFTIEPVDEETMRRVRRENLKNRGKRTEELIGERFVAQLIYEATIEEDKNRLWRNREVQERLNVGSGADVVQKVLTPAERSKLEDVLIEIGSYNDDGLDDLIKNV